ncbi:MAG: glycoside hydrolase family 13 protein [Actinomycetota bacterium]|nr:glycoside hydrolase family 13 protein [Actinomycetota bacterium]
MTNDTTWWRDAVIYQVYIRSFADSDGDGVGDLAGIRSRLSYLAELGVDALWITPFYPSPMADGGYDVADYRDIEPQFGSLDDADALVREAHELGLRVIIDIVPNHTSDRHRWFQEALAAAPGSPERSRYWFRSGGGDDGAQPPNNWPSVFGGPAWERVPDGEWYLHLFAPEQPDLNWANPEVVAEFQSILRFWLERGIDGFRIDVANALTKDEALPDVDEDHEEMLSAPDHPDHPFLDRDDVHEVYRGWRRVLDEFGPDRMSVAEAWVPNLERLSRYVRRDELHSAFNFDFLRSPWDAAELRRVIDATITSMEGVNAPPTWVLSNHDVVRVATRYGNLDGTGGGAGGIARPEDLRLDPALGLARARAAALLVLALPGSAYVYQGEELGLPEVVDLPEESLQDPIWERSGHTLRGRDGCRVPIPWEGDGPSYGFGPGTSWLPQPADWGELSVEAQLGVSGSVLELYRAALRIRRGEPSLGEGDLRWLSSPAGTLVFARDPGVVCAVNLRSAPVSLPPYGDLLLASTELTDPRTLPGDSAAWYRLD